MSKRAAADRSSLCFVVGPIGEVGSDIRKHADMMLNAVIRHVLASEALGYEVKRADEDGRPGMISDRVISDIISAELVVADLTGLNPNVFYELGIRHSALKPTIHITASGTVLPFDNFGHHAIFVDLADWASIESARKSLTAGVEAIKNKTYIVSNPITQANASFRMRNSDDPRERVVADLRDRTSALKAEMKRLTKLIPRPSMPAPISYVSVSSGVEGNPIFKDLGSAKTISLDELTVKPSDLNRKKK